LHLVRGTEKLLKKEQQQGEVSKPTRDAQALKLVVKFGIGLRQTGSERKGKVGHVPCESNDSARSVATTKILQVQ